MPSHTKSQRIAYIALFTAVSMIFSYVETLIPIDFGIPGVKIGLANIVSVICIYIYGAGYALIITILRVVLSGFLFTNLYSVIYSVAGGFLSILAMKLLKDTDRFSVIGVSILGGVFHNIGQLLVAIITVSQLKILFYGPILIISGVFMGVLTGLISKLIIKRIETYVRL